MSNNLINAFVRNLIKRRKYFEWNAFIRMMFVEGVLEVSTYH